MNNARSKKHYAVLFKIISQCNDFCDFCLEYDFIKSGRPSLSLEELKENYFYLKKKFAPDYYILTGGEPTLHSQFFEMLEFLKEKGEPFRLISNFLNFNNKEFLERLKIVFSGFKNDRQKNLSKVFASINDLPERSSAARKRFSGLKNVLKLGLPIMIMTVIYRQNVKDLSVLSARLVNLFKKFGKNKSLSLEFRPIYIEGTPPSLLKISMPKNFLIFKKAVEESADILSRVGANFILWNFPLCYLDDPKRFADKRMKEMLNLSFVKVHKNAQLKNAKIRDWEIYFKSQHACRRCALNNLCSGMDRDYIKKYNFPELRPVKI